MALSFISLGAFIWFIYKNWLKKYNSFVIALFTIIAAFTFYPSYNLEYYLMSFLTLFTIVIGYCLSSLPYKIGLFIAIFFMVVNIATITTLSDIYGLTVRKQLIKQTMKSIGGKSFSLETEGELQSKQFTYAGWRYLFKAYGETPSQSNVDSVLGWIYPDEISKSKPELKVIVSDTIKLTFPRKSLATFQSRDYYSYVLLNN